VLADGQTHRQTQTDFIICAMLYAIAMGQITTSNQINIFVEKKKVTFCSFDYATWQPNVSQLYQREGYFCIPAPSLRQVPVFSSRHNQDESDTSSRRTLWRMASASNCLRSICRQPRSRALRRKMIELLIVRRDGAKRLAFSGTTWDNTVLHVGVARIFQD